MTFEVISKDNLKPLAELIPELWKDCSFDEEFENYKTLVHSDSDSCFLAKDQDDYIGFIHLSLRNYYVEGSDSSPAAYAEALFVKQRYRKYGVAKQLLHIG